jgi:uncharacterized protein
MVRPRKIKIVASEPHVTYFKPRAIPLSQLEEVELTICELESLRLANLENLSQAKAAQKMDIHQSTFQRTLQRAREKTTDALVNGKAIKIQGGKYTMPNRDETGPLGRGRGLGLRKGMQVAGPVGTCICLACGYEEHHVRGQPCNQKRCPKCNKMMTRK